MRITGTIAVLSLCVVAGAAVNTPLPEAFGGPVAAAVLRGRADAAQAVPWQFLPWPPPVPGPGPSGPPSFVPSADPFDPDAVAATLEQVLAAVQSGMDGLWQWLEALRQAAAAALARIVLPLPIEAPGAAGPADVVTHVVALPDGWRAIIAAALAKLQVRDSADGTAIRHEGDIAASPELSHEAGTIASADQQVIAGAAQQEVATAATAAVAGAAARDTALPAVLTAAQATADQLVAGAQNLPSSRAGIELLVAGTGAGLRNQAALTAALAGRITGLMQQTAQLSGQIGTLASTIGFLAERDLERDRNALDARLGVADAARGGAALLEQLLDGAGEPADEIILDPLY
jgi:hypothetical protein